MDGPDERPEAAESQACGAGGVVTLRRAPDGGGGGGSERGLVGALCRYVRPVAPGHRRRQGGDGTAEHHWDFALSRVSQTMTSRAAERRHASDHRTLKVHRR